jgi:RNA polymerase sigma-70 factor, ECF subfamily
MISEDLLRQIYRDTIDPLYGYVSRRCGGVRELAEDVTQEAWLRAVRDWRRSGVPDNPMGWLTTRPRSSRPSMRARCATPRRSRPS